MCLANICKSLVSASSTSSDPTLSITLSSLLSDDNITVVTSNVLASFLHAVVAPAFTIDAHLPSHFLNAITIAYSCAIADTGTTSIFIKEGVDVANKRVAVKPLMINLPDGK
jgi:hypothetical protein